MTIDLTRRRWWRPTAAEWQVECEAVSREMFWWFCSDYWWRGNYQCGLIINGWKATTFNEKN